MNKLFKVLTLIAILAFMVIMFGTQIVQALRDAAAPPPLPYGLAAQNSMASADWKLGQSRMDFVDANV